jgi:hypothetical protein
MKKFIRMVSLCGPAALIFWACAIPVGEDFIMPRDSDQNGITIVDYNLESFVPVPYTGEHPVTEVTTRGDLQATVTWKDEDDNALPDLETFQPDTVYHAKIELTPREGYAFNPAITFGYHEGKIKTQSDDRGSPTRTVTVVYNNSNDGKITYVTDYHLQNYVPIPVAGETPIREIDVDGVTGRAIWKKGGTPLADTETFTEGETYTADIVLWARPDYRFKSESDFEYPPNAVATPPNINQQDPAERILDTVTYHNTKLPVTNLDLTGYIIAPEEGGSPVTAGFTDIQYTATSVIWEPEHPVFSATYSYTATVVLNATNDYAFTRNPGFYHSSVPVSSSDNTGSSIRVSIAFPAKSTVTLIIDGQY